jgi:hypothetical protein
MNPSSFDAKAEVARLKEQTKKRRNVPKKSSLSRFESQILALKQEGASMAEIQRWLRSKGLKVAHSTVSRWFAREHPYASLMSPMNNPVSTPKD